eukprot:TRINITY_DN107268_c0_g1_i1.p1 TRINITY_DN107268_c0_g1~~TRINITY_DN107268_c0_g1_i1.p1  ORF type:complete len:211 (+),score=27.96 TRINITY_DN107268_c0_g1_i1:73-705(+)
MVKTGKIICEQAEIPVTLGLAGLICYFVFSSAASAWKEQLHGVDPDVDFRLINDECTITSIKHEENLVKKYHPGQSPAVTWTCYDVYVYHGEVQGNAFTAAPEVIPRCSVSCALRSQKPSSYAEQQRVDCWSPAKRPVDTNTYDCGDETCIQIFSPDAQVAEKMYNIKVLKIGANIGLIVFVVCLVATAWIVRRVLRDQPSQRLMEEAEQ